MPVSHWRHIGPVMTAIEQCSDSKSILDIGPGFGKYGVLIRERFDVRFKRYNKEDWKTQIDCLEIWQPYITPLHSHIYNTIYIGDVMKTLDNMLPYDTIVALEILEHLPKEDGKVLLRKLVQKSNKLLVLSFPTHFKEGANSEWDNPYELHRCLWTKEELDSIIGETKRHSRTVYSKAF